MRNDTGIEDLFRRKLGNAELAPDPSVGTELMRKLGRKEFVRFNPSRFNVYYLAVIVAAAVTAGILLFSKHPSPEKQPPSPEVVSKVEAPVSIIPAITSTPQTRPGKTISAKTVIDPVTRQQSVTTVATENVRTSNEIIGTPEVRTAIPEKLISGSQEQEKPRLQQMPVSGGPMFVASAYSGCIPLKVYFDNLTDSFEKFSWSFGDGGTSDKAEPVWTYEREGEYTVTLTGKKPNGETETYSALITVYPTPKAVFETTPGNAVIPDDEITFLNNSTGALSYKWDFGDGSGSSLFEPKHRYSKFDKYIISLTVTSDYGCTDTYVNANAFTGSGFFIRMPNAFIPNPQGPSGGLFTFKSDETAEIFHPVSSGVADYQLQIFSKIGILLFESKDINTGWDGYFNGQLCNPGVYVWKVTGRFSNGEPFVKMGDVTLLKN